MQRLSSSMTFFYKRVFPVLWFGFIVIFMVGWFGIGIDSTRPHVERPDRWMELLPPLLMGIIGGIVFKLLIFNLVDEVWLEGDTVMVKNRGESTRLPLTDVINVNCTTMTNPPRITLSLRTESSRLGSQVNFIPAGRRGLLSAFKSNPIADDLIRRIDALRRRPG